MAAVLVRGRPASSAGVLLLYYESADRGGLAVPGHTGQGMGLMRTRRAYLLGSVGALLLPGWVAAEGAATADRYARVWRDCQKQGLVAGEDATARYRVCRRGDVLVAVEETPRAASGKAPSRLPAIRYFYEADVPLAVRTAVPAGAVGSGHGADGGTVPVQIDWTAGGEVVRAVRVEHFGEVRLGDTDVSHYRERALVLVPLARAAVAP